MKLKRHTAKWPDYYAAKRAFDAKQKRSRTYVDKLKAIRLPRPVNNTLLYQDGEDMVFRLYGTDIIRYQPNNTCEILSGGWVTPTTFQRVYQITGVNIGSHRGSGNKSEYRSRVAIVDEYKKDIPYFDGLKFDLTSGEVLNVEDIPSDVAKSKQRPTKEAQKKFREIWKEIHPRIMLGVNLGVWAEEILGRAEDMGRWYTPAPAPIVINDIAKCLIGAIDRGEALSDLELQSVVLIMRRRSHFSGNTTEKITDQLRQELPTIRSKLQYGVAKELGMLEDAGGVLLGGTYHTNPKDQK